MGWTVCLRCKGKTLLGVVNKLLKTKMVNTEKDNSNFHNLSEMYKRVLMLPKQSFNHIVWVLLAAWQIFPEKKIIFAKAKIRGLPNDVRTTMECLGVGHAKKNVFFSQNKFCNIVILTEEGHGFNNATFDYYTSLSFTFKNLFMSFCTIFLYVILWWHHDILGWKFIMILLSFKLFLWNLFWGKFKT